VSTRKEEKGILGIGWGFRNQERVAEDGPGGSSKSNAPKHYKRQNRRKANPTPR